MLRLEWLNPADLRENGRNWRRHPEQQIAALTDVIAEVGWAGACLYNERTGRLVDGHARQKVALAQGADKVPVLVGDWSEEDEAKILATLDPLAGMATKDGDALAALLAEVHTDSDAINELLDAIAGEGLTAEFEAADGGGDAPAEFPAEKYQVLIECRSEAEQAALLLRLTNEGLKCRSLIA